MKPFIPFRRNRWPLIAIVLLFVGGVGISYFLIESGWHPAATKNYGELVNPPRMLRDAAFVDFNDRPVRLSAFKGKWTLFYFGSAECSKVCTDNLYKMRQITAAQGREMHRIQRIFVVTDPRARDVLRYTMVDYPGTEILMGPAEAVRELASQFNITAGSPLDGLNRVYIVDPLGNFMMSYPADADPRRMSKDLGHLLRASHIG